MMCFINFLGVKVQKIFGIDVIFLNFFEFYFFRHLKQSPLSSKNTVILRKQQKIAKNILRKLQKLAKNILRKQQKALSLP